MRKSLVEQDCVVADAVAVEPVSASNFPYPFCTLPRSTSLNSGTGPKGHFAGRHRLGPSRLGITSLNAHEGGGVGLCKATAFAVASWWAETLETSPQGMNEEAGGTVRIGISLRGKQARIIKYLAERFPNGVPEPAIQPRNQLKDDVLRTDPTLRPLDESTLKKSIDTYNASLGKQKSHPK